MTRMSLSILRVQGLLKTGKSSVGKMISKLNRAHSYRFSLFTPVLKALGISVKTSLRINEVGLLSMQFMIPAGDSGQRTEQAPRVTFVEYLISPNIELDD